MSAEINHLMDIYLAIKESGGSTKQAYTLKEASEMRKMFEVLEQKHIKKEVSYLHLREENERLLTELKEVTRVKIELNVSLVNLSKKLNDLFRGIEKIKLGVIDPDSEIKRMNKEAGEIAKTLEKSTPFDYEAELRKLRELEIKEQSFRFTNIKSA
jgi:hypothetical protein